MKIGIDQITFYIPKTYLPLELLAKKNRIPFEKYSLGLMQEKMAIASFNQDIITMGLNASIQLINKDNKDLIGMVIFTTESSIDYSKSSSIYIADYLKLKDNVEVIEIKQACFGMSQALMLAENYILANPSKQVLVIGSDIAQYAPGSSAEPTGGAGAVSLIVKSNPKILEFNNDAIKYQQNVHDFYRPNNHKYPIVDGHYANEVYEEMFNHVFTIFKQSSVEKLINLKGVAFHVPYGKLPMKIVSKTFNSTILQNFINSLNYGKNIGNIYNGSLFLNLINLLDSRILKAGDLIGLFSYGSGATAQFMTMSIVENYDQHLNTLHHKKLLENRINLSYSAYKKILHNKNKNDYLDGPFIIESINKLKIKKYIKR